MKKGGRLNKKADSLKMKKMICLIEKGGSPMGSSPPVDIYSKYGGARLMGRDS